VKLGTLLTAWLLASSAQASDAATKFAAAQNALEAAQYQKAAQLAAEGLQAGDGGPDDVCALHALSAEVAAATGDSAGAVRSFSVVLSLCPSYRPRSGASPRILDPFTRALERTPRPLQHQLSLRRGEAQHLEVTVDISEDGLGLVEGARMSRAGKPSAGLRRAKSTPLSYEGTVTCPAPCDLRLELVDEWGNRLVQSPLSESVVPSLAMGSEHVAVQPGRKLYQRPGFYLALTSVALLAAGIYSGVRAQNEQSALFDINSRRSENHYSDALSLEQSRKTHDTYMWLGLGAAALSGVGAVWLW
jgi:hypothetical protein